MIRPQRSPLPGFLVVILSLLIPACDTTEPEEETPLQTPDFILPDLSGNNFQLSAEQGKVVILHFFAHYCGACRTEAPILNQIYQKYNERGVVLVAVAVGWTTEDQVRGFANEFGVEYRILLDDGNVSGAYSITAVPKTFFVAKSGRIDSWYSGALSRQDFETVVDNLIGG